MPYYTSPGGEITAAYGRSLMGAVPANIRMYRRPTVPPAVLAQRMLAARENSLITMTGMGILPSVNVRYAKTAIPAALAARRQRQARASQQMQGLGKGGGRAMNVHARPVDVFAPGSPIIARQRAFFMGPGGGPGGGPFRMPGYTMTGMGLSDDMQPPDVGISPIPPPPPIITDTSQPAPPPAWFTIGKPTAPPVPGAMAPPSVPPPAWVSNRVPLWLQPTTLFAKSSASSASGTTFGVSNTVLAVGLASIVGLAVLRGGRGRR
jgi:hypothetical protein